MEYCIIGSSRCGTTSLHSWLQSYELKGTKESVRFSDFRLPIELYASNKECKIIMLVRDPADRAYSHWLYNRICFPSTEISKFSDAIQLVGNKYISDGMYYKTFLNFYKFKNVMILNLIDNDNITVIKKILKFLKINYNSRISLPILNSNRCKNPNNKISPSEREYLNQFFCGDQQKLTDIM